VQSNGRPCRGGHLRLDAVLVIGTRGVAPGPARWRFAPFVRAGRRACRRPQG